MTYAGCLQSQVASRKHRKCISGMQYETLKVALAEWDLASTEHSIRVRIQASYIGTALGLGGHDLTLLSYGAQLHDIGKLRVPRDILLSGKTLSAKDLAVYRSHAECGADVVQSAGLQDEDIITCVRDHHERENGSGYPRGLRSRQIHPLAKIVAVADQYVGLIELGYCDADALLTLVDDNSGAYDRRIVSMLAHVVMQSKVNPQNS